MIGRDGIRRSGFGHDRIAPPSVQLKRRLDQSNAEPASLDRQTMALRGPAQAPVLLPFWVKRLQTMCTARGMLWPMAAAPTGDCRVRFRGYNCRNAGRVAWQLMTLNCLDVEQLARLLLD